MQEPLSEIAQTLGALRREREMSLQSLAKVSGVAASTLSKIERDELSPTVATLQKIASGLGVEMSDIFVESSEREKVQGRRSVTRAGLGTEHTTLSCYNRLLCSDLMHKKMIPTLTRVTARDVKEAYPSFPRSDAEVFLMVIRGRMILHSQVYEPLELGPGDSIYYDASAGHAWTSVGDEDAEVVWVMSS